MRLPRLATKHAHHRVRRDGVAILDPRLADLLVEDALALGAVVAVQLGKAPRDGVDASPPLRLCRV